MQFSMWIFFSALFCVTYISYARSLSDDDLFLPIDGHNNGNAEYTSLPILEDDQELLSFEDSPSLFSFNEDLDSSIPISQDWDSSVFLNDDSASAPLFIDDASILTTFDDDSPVALNDLLLTLSSEEPENPASKELSGANDSDSELFSDISCTSDEEQTVGKSRRGEDVCPVVNLGKKAPPFPPPFANRGRFNDLPENDPKRRPSNQQKNSRADFIECPSGPGGYRMYLICDSGNEADRMYSAARGVSLVNLKVNRGCMLLFLPPTCAKTADSQKQGFHCVCIHTSFGAVKGFTSG